jgi:photosystem II stability/assembly factor-like uncharacterized protein
MRLLILLFFAGLVAALSGCAGSPGADQGAPDVKAQIGWATGAPVNGYGVILHTSDGGNTWVQQGSASEIPDYAVIDIRAMDALNAWAVAAGTGGAILRTRDGGITWVQQKATTFGLNGIGVVDGNTAWAVGNNGKILHTSDSGATWTEQDSGTKAALNVVAAVDAMNAWIIGDADKGYAVILRTTDGGATWSRQGTADTKKTTGLIDISAVDGSTAWAVGTETTVLKTVDGGATWSYQLFSEGLSSAHVNGVCAFDTQHAWIAEDFDGIGSTTDGGGNWIQQTSPVTGYYLISVTMLDLNTIWIVGAAMPPNTQLGVILHSVDGGATWTGQTSPVNSLLRRVSFVGARK